MSAVSGGQSRNPSAGPRPPLAVPARLLRLRSDAALAERIAAGDEGAFDVLYERHRPVVLAVCMGILGIPQDAEDATQEAFSALTVALRSQGVDEVRPWLLRVARNAAIDTTRRRKHRLLTADGELPEPAVVQRSGKEEYEGKEEFEAVLEGIRRLPETQRTALLMRELSGHSYGEIASLLETDEATVRGLIARARSGLRNQREAADLPCASARTCIDAEPDGRRYDRATRRHLRGCSQCRDYRASVREDGRRLRAGFAIQSGSAIGGGGLVAGAMSAAKATLVAASVPQLAATCASVCAIGTVGGIVLLAPSHPIRPHRALSAAPNVPRTGSTPQAAGAGAIKLAPARPTGDRPPAHHHHVRNTLPQHTVSLLGKGKLPPLIEHEGEAGSGSATLLKGGSGDASAGSGDASSAGHGAASDGSAPARGDGHGSSSDGHGAPTAGSSSDRQPATGDGGGSSGSDSTNRSGSGGDTSRSGGSGTTTLLNGSGSQQSGDGSSAGSDGSTAASSDAVTSTSTTAASNATSTTPAGTTTTSSTPTGTTTSTSTTPTSTSTTPTTTSTTPTTTSAPPPPSSGSGA